MDQSTTEFIKACLPAYEYLCKQGDPFLEIRISLDDVTLRNSEINVPRKAIESLDVVFLDE